MIIPVWPVKPYEAHTGVFTFKGIVFLIFYNNPKTHTLFYLQNHFIVVVLNQKEGNTSIYTNITTRRYNIYED